MREYSSWKSSFHKMIQPGLFCCCGFFVLFLTCTLPVPEDAGKITALIESGKIEEALEALPELVRRQPENKATWDLAGRVFDLFISRERNTELVDVAFGLTEDLDQYTEAWFLLGKVYLAQAVSLSNRSRFELTLQQSVLSQAIQSFRTALKRNPECVPAGTHLAYALFLLGDLPEAHKQALAVLNRHPEPYAAYLLGEIELRSGRPKQALDHFEKALHLDSGFHDALTGKIRTLMAMENRIEAREALLALARKYPESPEIPALAQSLFEALGRHRDAAELYKALIEIIPNNREIRFLLAIAEYRLNESESSRIHLTTILESRPDHDGALFFLGLIEEKRKQYASAGKRYLEALKVNGNYFESSLQRLRVIAYLEAAGGRFQDAIALYDILRAFYPFDTNITANRALALAQSGHLEEAEQAYKAFLELIPGDSKMLNEYGLFLKGIGRVEEGLKILEEAFLSDGNSDAGENLGSYYFYVCSDKTKAESYLMSVAAAKPYREKVLVLLEAIRRDRFRQGASALRNRHGD